MSHERGLLDAALSGGDDAAALAAAERLVLRAVNLATYLNHPIHEAIQEFSASLAQAASRYGEGTPRFQAELNSATTELQFEIREVMEDRDFDRNSAYETQTVLSFLRSHDENSVRSLEGSAKDRAQLTQRLFDRYLDSNESAQKQCVDDAEREKLFQEFLEGYQQAEDRRLARELRNNNLRKEAKHTLLQVAALLRNTGKDYLTDQADFLMTLISREELLTRQSTSSRP